MVWFLTYAKAPAAPVFPAAVTLAGRKAGTLACAMGTVAVCCVGTASGMLARWQLGLSGDVPLKGVLGMGYHLWSRHQLSTWEICIHLFPALSLCATAPPVKWGSEVSISWRHFEAKSIIMGSYVEGSKAWRTPSETFWNQAFAW